MAANLDSFGRIDRRPRQALTPDLAIASLGAGGPSLLAFGNGKSYGDSCHNDAGALVPMRSRRAILAFDAATGILTAEAGASLEEIIAHTAPHGYFLPVTPGTRFVTLGGAIANDVHGKNHHVRGTFGCHVTGFELLRSDGARYACSATQNSELFAATIGGMGLTGIILSASIKLMRVGSLDIEEEITPFSNLEGYFDLAEGADAANEYAVAWVDQLSRSNRGVLLTGNHADNGNFKTARSATRLSVPFEMPFSMLNGLSLTAFNFAYFHAKARKSNKTLSGYGSFFYPLDAVGNWNRLYGPKGLFQHQSVIPFEAARAIIPQMLEASREAGQASFLTVLKRFGAVASPGTLSFPRPGYTLTMDFSNRGASTLKLLERLDALTTEAGGRVNPYKDQRMSAATFAAGFPEWTELEAYRDPRFFSDFWRRTALSLSAHAPALAAE
ncbi:FAD-linked oxidase [Devosia sp. Root685]|uniref:FAD-binding oxidoreductase n=1 Tax=Devosia sp. Root685 TaxID=1736587 RepID=UPI0006F78610|nr:FAD-binding oxidoreductase [Devosia sp. Root685]KRA95537.1 FAD-linked oxidase [Devosia sp. Root685]